MAVFFMLVALIVSVNGQTFHLGSCPTPPVQQNFDVGKYLGRWYEIAKLPAVFEKGKCHQATYSLLKKGVVKVVNAELLHDGKVNSIEGQATVTNLAQPAKLDVTLFKGIADAPYWVISTDYTSYSVVYSCKDVFGLLYVDFAWILARSRSLPANTVSQLRGDLESHGVSLSGMTSSDQVGCNAMPEGQGQ
ncbi:apolipoprotein D-like [Alosa sapidissima]|uniref:apolipoprotein D-like n=1 Tax=Alosa sapidissima TaxID=34773 RepID=UPI001C0A3605|nr:apolipoprotein D-like [Alosa sapidissima]XP_041924593.1 apolipoprotein D-like [Alosa sapidissima]XP_041924594.1 apolipoprotein D-like [Alosa sapidissima]XP_041924595.1 apolipoprotein D-like [Alosa sapidissima]XP_041924596.1 apolipoprotein D-like [Alosa sapidissima]